MTAGDPIIEARSITFAYAPGRVVLDAVDMAGRAGRLLCVLGPNGSGKTTLLRCLLGQLRPSSGSVFVRGVKLDLYSSKRLARHIAYVPQTPVSVFPFPVRELVLMGRFCHTGVMGLASKKDRDVARQAMIMTETIEFADRSLEELSGGEAQRVMIARALAQQPSVMLLDEPTSHLDIRHQVMIYRMMVRLAHDWGMAVICVSHDVNLAGRFADELLLMRAGNVLADGPAEQVIDAETLRRAYDVPVELIAVPDEKVPLVRAK